MWQHRDCLCDQTSLPCYGHLEVTVDCQSICTPLVLHIIVLKTMLSFMIAVPNIHHWRWTNTSLCGKGMQRYHSSKHDSELKVCFHLGQHPLHSAPRYLAGPRLAGCDDQGREIVEGESKAGGVTPMIFTRETDALNYSTRPGQARAVCHSRTTLHIPDQNNVNWMQYWIKLKQVYKYTQRDDKMWVGFGSRTAIST